MTKTFTTTNIVIDAVRGRVWAEDFSHNTYPGIKDPFRMRAARFLDGDHMRLWETVGPFTEWLHEVGAIVEECTILGGELSDKERAA